MSNDQAILRGDRLDSGMKASEAVARAALWWDRTGRRLMGKVARDDPVMAQCSSICAGVDWGHLTNRERLIIVKAWHHFKIRRADVLDIDPDAKFKLGGEEQVQ